MITTQTLLVPLLGLLAADGAAPSKATVSGTVTGCSGKHDVYIALHGETIFKKGKPLATVVKSKSDVVDGQVRYEIHYKPGVYTISVFEDENDNGVVDMGWFGPKEPAGFFRKFTAWRPPKFEDVRFELKDSVQDANIELD